MTLSHRCLCVFGAASLLPLAAVAQAPTDLVIRNATVMTASHGTIPNGAVWVHNGKIAGVDATVSYMRKLPREAPPGTKWVYKTGETNLIGVLVSSATHKSLADYLSEKIWRPYGMEQDAVWMIDDRGQEPGGCCISVSLHDYARMGELILDDGRIQGRSILPTGWIEAATHKAVETGDAGGGYGYQWWTRDDGSVDARGIFGQGIHIDPKRKLVIVMSSAWAHATDRKQAADRTALYSAIAKAVKT